MFWDILETNPVHILLPLVEAQTKQAHTHTGSYTVACLSQQQVLTRLFCSSKENSGYEVFSFFPSLTSCAAIKTLRFCSELQHLKKTKHLSSDETSAGECVASMQTTKNILSKTSIHQKQRADHVTSSWNLTSSAVEVDQGTSRQETNTWGISCLIQDSKEVTEMTRTCRHFKLINYLMAGAGKFHFNLWL